MQQKMKGERKPVASEKVIKEVRVRKCVCVCVCVCVWERERFHVFIPHYAASRRALFWQGVSRQAYEGSWLVVKLNTHTLHGYPNSIPIPTGLTVGQKDRSIYNTVEGALMYLDSRTEFWRQQKPMYARKREKELKKYQPSPTRARPTGYPFMHDIIIMSCDTGRYMIIL